MKLEDDTNDDMDDADEQDQGGFASAKHFCPHIGSALVIPKDPHKFPKLS